MKKMIVPHTSALQELHEAHPGVSRMKSLAQMFVWWPGLDEDIEATVKHCQRNPDMNNYILGSGRVTSGLCWTFMGKMFLVLVDTTS